MTVRSRQSLLMPNMGRRSTAYPRGGGRHCIPGYPQARGHVGPEPPGTRYVFTIGNSGSAYGFADVYGDIQPPEMSSTEIIGLFCEEGLPATITLRFLANAQPHQSINLYMGNRVLPLFWNLDHYEADSAVFQAYIISNNGFSVPMWLEGVDP